MCSHSDSSAEFCRAARDLEREVGEVNTVVRVVHLENTNRQRERRDVRGAAGTKTHMHTFHRQTSYPGEEEQ